MIVLTPSRPTAAQWIVRQDGDDVEVFHVGRIPEDEIAGCIESLVRLLSWFPRLPDEDRAARDAAVAAPRTSGAMPRPELIDVIGDVTAKPCGVRVPGADAQHAFRAIVETLRVRPEGHHGLLINVNQISLAIDYATYQANATQLIRGMFPRKGLSTP